VLEETKQCLNFGATAISTMMVCALANGCLKSIGSTSPGARLNGILSSNRVCSGSNLGVSSPLSEKGVTSASITPVPKKRTNPSILLHGPAVPELLDFPGILAIENAMEVSDGSKKLWNFTAMGVFESPA
jgi:hypothetical protein